MVSHYCCQGQHTTAHARKHVAYLHKMADCDDMNKSALSFKILAECPVSKARVAKMRLPHHNVDTPVFMPVGTQGTLKAMTPQQLIDLDCQLILGNTYHLGNRPVSNGNILTTNNIYGLQSFRHTHTQAVRYGT